MVFGPSLAATGLVGREDLCMQQQLYSADFAIFGTARHPLGLAAVKKRHKRKSECNVKLIGATPHEVHIADLIFGGLSLPLL